MPGGLFIAEGEQVVRRLLASRFETDSVLLAARRAEEMLPAIPENVTAYVAPDEVVNSILGFKFHSGVMAAGRRGRSPGIQDVKHNLVVACTELANTENLGAMIRIAAAFGADAMLLGERSCDPFFRQSVRVSMGTVFSLPIVRSNDIVGDLRWLKSNGVELIATVLDESAEKLSTATRSQRMAILFGNEAQGLSDEHVALCDRRITIPMKLGTDSLNVFVAAGIFLHHFTR
jgi:tRNA G18 (ribose-2'-O)-methylase SpoU